eukprot:Hpha_TRINITY_DN16125_c3_g8::TRINITY_DN16125_c3_g8_i1::g.7018::m.7018/K00809/DHPS, dys; deoxyhypusine synthase
MAAGGDVPAAAQEAVFVGSGEMPADSIAVEGVDMAKRPDLGDVVSSMLTTGFQATNFGLACQEAERMLSWCLGENPAALEQMRKSSEISDEEAKVCRTRIFLGVTSAQLLGGIREAVAFLCRHRMIQVLVTPGGGIDADLIRTLAPEAVRVGDGPGARVCNLRIDLPKARDAVFPYVRKVITELADTNPVSTPSELARLLGSNLPEGKRDGSVLYWLQKREIPFFCPSIVDGMIGEVLFEVNRERRREGKKVLQLDLVADVRGMNTQATSAKHTGVIILGGGLVKHHICNANLMRNGSDHSIFLGTGQEFDGSDAGARPDEAVSWGKIRIDTKPVKVYADTSVVFPALVAKVFVPFLRAHPELYPN